jgi:DNA-binding phage protein
MVRPRTGAERYLAARLGNPGYRAEYEAARRRIAQVDAFVEALDARRAAMGLTKAELARRAGMKPEAIRRLFSVERPNPTLSTLVALAGALDLEIRPQPLPSRAPANPAQSVA